MGDSVKSVTEVQDKWLSCILEGMTLTGGSLRGEESAVTLMERSCAAAILFHHRGEWPVNWAMPVKVQL